jgi:hypothetical protein
MKLRPFPFLFACFALAPIAFSGELTVVEEAKWPEVWGDLGVRGFFPGERIAPNGIEYDPVFALDVHLNIGLLPQKKLYLFADTDFWAQRAATGITNPNYGSYDFSKREFNADLGLAWNVVDRFELRGSIFGYNSLNRGVSETLATTYQNGVVFEGRYYFGNANIYDTGRLSFVSLGYYPEENLMGAAGREFRAGLFAQAHVTYDLPAIRSYVFADAKVIGENGVDPRLVRTDAGLAVRPLASLPNLELRIGDEFTADLKDDTNRNLVYGSVRGYFGGGTQFRRDDNPALYEIARSPEVWGDLGVSAFPGGDRIASNGAEFTALAMSDLNFNIGLLPHRKLYLFVENQFWVQRESGAGEMPARDPAVNEVSEREWDIDAGFAFNFFSRFELRASVYALNNLNRGGFPGRPPDPVAPSGFNDGGHAQIRYYFSSANPYDPSRQSFVEVGYYPSHTLPGGDGDGLHPGAFGHAYLSYDLPRLRSYLFADGRFIASKDEFRLMIINGGVATRPFSRFENLEFRLGTEVTHDTGPDTTRNLTYGAIRINFSTR